MKLLDVIVICIFIVAFFFLFHHYFITPQQQDKNYNLNIIKTIEPNISQGNSELNYTNQIITENKTTSNQTSETLSKPKENKTITLSETIKIANWNLQIFGDTKASKLELMNFYVDTIDHYDIVFVQEIRDVDGSSFVSLCSMLQDYDCKVSSRAGRSTSKEQYGIIYKKGITAEVKDYNPDVQDRWERPPVAVTFDIDGYNLVAYNIHTKPDDVSNEMNNLESIVKDEGNVVVLGDLNADCDYYHNAGQDFGSWTWLIKDNQDTTLAQTDCAYDRIIVNSDLNNEVLSSGIYTNGITSEASDHYLVWFEINTNE